MYRAGVCVLYTKRMSVVKRIVGFVWTLVWVAGLCGVGYFFYYEKLPCKQPIAYKIGTLDPRFGVSESDFEKDITQASGLWSGAAGKLLFVHDSHGALTISLVYDTRQQTSQEEVTQRAAINQTSQNAAQIKAQYMALQQEYTTASQTYEQLVAQYNQSPNRERAAGARAEIEVKRLQVNTLADQINSLIKQYNGLVDQINANVSAINNDGLTGTQFEEGVYIADAQGTRINVYQFDNKTAFIRVLAHELGHAIGLEHNDNIDSIMSPVNQSKSLSLSPEDLAALKTECGI